MDARGWKLFEVTRREQRILGEQFREEERTGRMFPLSEREAARRWALGGWRHRAFWEKPTVARESSMTAHMW